MKIISERLGIKNGMKTVDKSYKLRIYPNKEQEKALLKNIGCSRFVYNQCLEAHKRDYKLAKQLGATRFFFGRDYYNEQLKYLKNIYEWLKEADSTSLQASYENLNTAFRNFFQNRSGFPRFKSKKKFKKKF